MSPLLSASFVFLAWVCWLTTGLGMFGSLMRDARDNDVPFTLGALAHRTVLAVIGAFVLTFALFSPPVLLLKWWLG